MLQTYKLFFNISTFFPTFVLYRRVINTIVGMRNIIIADNQDITRAGITYLLSQIDGCFCQMVTDKSGLIAQLKEQPESVIIVDYTLFDFVGETDLQIITLRFPRAHIILWSEDLSLEFIQSVVNMDNKISILLKDARMSEIQQCIEYALRGERYLCQHVTEMLLTPISAADKESTKLTKTETEILKDIALGMTTREIAEKRFSSFHTVNTHRKNIFRKLGVNNVYEAIRYAMRMGLVDAAEYYI